MITLALPKGRIFDEILPLLQAAGISVAEDPEKSRKLIIDFKTGRVPATDGDIPNAHRAQMAAYVEALQVIFPGRRVSASQL